MVTSAMEMKKEQGVGRIWGAGGGTAVLDRIGREGLSEKMKRLEGNGSVRHVDIRESINTLKDPEVGACLRNIRKPVTAVV